MADRFELDDGKSSKFWEISRTGKNTVVRYGRIGSDGRKVEKMYDNAADAKSAVEKLIHEKTRKGYKAVAKSTAKKPRKAKAAPKRSPSNRSTATAQPKPGEVVDVTGLFDAKDPDGVWHPNETYTFVTKFQAWRLTKGEMLKGSLRIEDPKITARKFNSQYKKFKPNTIRRVKLKLVKPRGSKQLIGQLVKDLGPAKDAELTKTGKTAKKQTSVQDAKLGKLAFHRTKSAYEGSPKWLNKKVELTIEAPSHEDFEQKLKQAHTIWAKQKSIDQRIRKFTCDYLLDDANDWLEQQDEGAKPISAAAFKRRIKMASIDIEENGKLVFWLDDDDMFEGHVICVYADKTGKPTAATIQG